MKKTQLNTCWQHFEQFDAETEEWLKYNTQLTNEQISILCDDLTRPRVVFTETDQVICILRVIHKESESDFSMVSVRFFFDKQQLISLSLYSLPAISQLIQVKNKSTTPIDFFYRTCEAIVDNITAQIVEMDEKIHNIHDKWTDEEAIDSNDILATRKQVSHIQRFLLSQADVFQKLYLFFCDKKMEIPK